MGRENRIREVRQRAGLTRRQFAERAGIGEERIAYAESGCHSLKLDLAFHFAEVLRVDMGELFPEARPLLGEGKRRKPRNELVELHYDSEMLRSFEAAGIDLDPATWILRMRLRGGAQVGFATSTASAARLRRALYDQDSSTPFFVFYASRVAVAVNLNHLLHYHELWDGHTSYDWHDESIAAEEVGVVLSDSPEWLTFDVDADEGDAEEGGDLGEMQALLVTLDTLVEENEFLDVMDTDGESAFFRAHDVALLTVPLRILYPDLNDALVSIDMGEDDSVEVMTEGEESPEAEPPSP